MTEQEAKEIADRYKLIRDLRVLIAQIKKINTPLIMLSFDKKDYLHTPREIGEELKGVIEEFLQKKLEETKF